MDKPKILDFSLQDKETLIKTEKYVMFQSGKGKEDNSQIFIKAYEFSFLEGLIWDKYREYGMRKKTKILSSECERIITGFDEAILPLTNYTAKDDLKKILQFDLFRPQNDVNDVLDSTKEIKELVFELNTWLSKETKEEKYVSIIKKYL